MTSDTIPQEEKIAGLTQQPTESSLSAYLAFPDAVLGEEGIQWRYGRAPDYSKHRQFCEETRNHRHPPLSLANQVENLIKNWEIEASFKLRLSDWRTINPSKYSFAMNSGEPQSAEHMLRVGTYNAILAAPSDLHCPVRMGFEGSHKSFKRMLRNGFAWEVIEVYSPPPRVSFRWRHWGRMEGDYVGVNGKEEKVRVRAHGRVINIEGVAVADVDEKVRLCAVRMWMDPLDLFRQIAPDGVHIRDGVDEPRVDNDEDMTLEIHGEI